MRLDENSRNAMESDIRPFVVESKPKRQPKAKTPKPLKKPKVSKKPKAVAVDKPKSHKWQFNTVKEPKEVKPKAVVSKPKKVKEPKLPKVPKVKVPKFKSKPEVELSKEPEEILNTSNVSNFEPDISENLDVQIEDTADVNVVKTSDVVEAIEAAAIVSSDNIPQEEPKPQKKPKLKVGKVPKIKTVSREPKPVKSAVKTKQIPTGKQLSQSERFGLLAACSILVCGVLLTGYLAFNKTQSIVNARNDGGRYVVAVNSEFYDLFKRVRSAMWNKSVDSTGLTSEHTTASTLIPDSLDFTTSDGILWVLINGTKYPVVETAEGLMVVTHDSNMGAYDADGKPIIGVTEDGSLIVGYDENENPIYGVTSDEKGIHEVPIGDVIGVNPYILTDEYGNRYYHIVNGDTLCKISSLVHYSVDELADYNHIRNVHLIYSDSDLRIPETVSGNDVTTETEEQSVDIPDVE